MMLQMQWKRSLAHTSELVEHNIAKWTSFCYKLYGLYFIDGHG